MSRDDRHVDPMVRQCGQVGTVEENSELRPESLEFPVSRRQKGTGTFWVKGLRVGQTRGFRLRWNGFLGLFPEMRKMGQATAQEKGLGSKARLGLYIFSMWKTKGLLGFGSKMSVNDCVPKVSMVFSCGVTGRWDNLLERRGFGRIKTGQGTFEWDIKVYHHHPTPLLLFCYSELIIFVRPLSQAQEQGSHVTMNCHL